MEAVVVVPWRPGCPHREAAWRWVRDAYERAGWRTVEGEAPVGPWRKASALAAGIAQTDTDTLILADADVWVEPHRLRLALEQVDRHGWAIPHYKVHRLTEQATTDVYAGASLDGDVTEPPYKGWEGGGIVVIRRDVWDRVPMDPRFADWGHEDDSWAYALRTLVGRAWRGHGRLWHLWHPPQPRQTRRLGSPENQALRERYGQAARDPQLMEALVEEARHELAVSPRP